MSLSTCVRMITGWGMLSAQHLSNADAIFKGSQSPCTVGWLLKVCVRRGTDAPFINFSMAYVKTEQVGMRAGSVGGWKPTQKPAAVEQRWHCHVVSTQKAGSKGVTAHFHLLSYTWQEAAAGGKASEMRLHFLARAFSLCPIFSLFVFCIISHMSILFFCTLYCRELLQNRSQLRERAGLYFRKSIHASILSCPWICTRHLRVTWNHAASQQHNLFFILDFY